MRRSKKPVEPLKTPLAHTLVSTPIKWGGVKLGHQILSIPVSKVVIMTEAGKHFDVNCRPTQHKKVSFQTERFQLGKDLVVSSSPHSQSIQTVAFSLRNF